MILLKPIRNYSDYLEAQKQLESIFHSDLDSEEGQKAEILSILIESYERKMNPPIEEIKDINIEPLIDCVYDLVENTSNLESDEFGITERGLKLNEEVGELSAEILKLVGYKRSGLNKDEIRKEILKESVDCLIMVFDIMSFMGFTKQEIVEMSEEKINKWLNDINKEVK